MSTLNYIENSHKRVKLNNTIEQIDQTTQNKQSNTDKELKYYKIFIFDLDYTLYLHNNDKKYHLKVKNLLNYLKDNNKLLYVATHNKKPEYYLDKIHITKLFDGIIKEKKTINNKDNIFEYTNKKDMIIEILSNNKDYSVSDVIFFDDHYYNIQQVNSIGVKSILVNSLIGIDFDSIY